MIGVDMGWMIEGRRLGGALAMAGLALLVSLAGVSPVAAQATTDATMTATVTAADYARAERQLR